MFDQAPVSCDARGKTRADFGNIDLIFQIRDLIVQFWWCSLLSRIELSRPFRGRIGAGCSS